MTSAFVVVSGLPGSGKTTLGRAIAASLRFGALDKDDFLDALLVRAGASVTQRRRELSRESDALFREAALAADRAVLISFWHLNGMAADSGTPTDWLHGTRHRLVHVHCECAPLVAAERFLNRQRHAGHGDNRRTLPELHAEFGMLSSLELPALGPLLRVNTNAGVEPGALVEQIRAQLALA